VVSSAGKAESRLTITWLNGSRAKQICEGDEYVNYICHADWADNRTRRNIQVEESYTFFVYEEILAFKKAAVACDLTRSDIEDIFFNNAYRLLTGSSSPSAKKEKPNNVR